MPQRDRIRPSWPATNRKQRQMAEEKHVTSLAFRVTILTYRSSKRWHNYSATLWEAGRVAPWIKVGR